MKSATGREIKRTTRKVYLKQCFDGLEIVRTIYTDGLFDYVKVNGILFELNDLTSNVWEIIFIA